MTKFLIEIDTDAGTASIVGQPSSGPANEDWRNETGFPKIVQFGRARFMLTAPINPKWRPSANAEVIGAAPAHLADPSGGARSPAGFPLVDGRVLWGESTFANDAEVLDYITRVALRDANLIAGDAATAANAVVLQPGALDIRTLDADGLKFLWTFGNEIGGDSTKVGPADLRKRFHHWLDYAGNADDGTGHAPTMDGLPATAGWPVAEFQKVRNGAWDWSGYHGPARALVPRLGP